jgi:hypothetical protein
MGASRPLFLETTAAIGRHFGTRAHRVFLADAVTGRQIITSTFVLFEYKRVVQRACVEFHRLLTRERNLSEALRVFSQSYSVSQLSIGLSLFYPLFEEAGHNVSEVLERLAWLIDYDLMRLFRAGVDEILDPTRCALAFQQPQHQGATYAPGFLSVARATFDCNLPGFIETHRDDFQAIYTAMTAAGDPRTRRLRQVLARVIRHPEESRGRNALTLGDAIIAVEMPGEAFLLTTNRGDFEPLCAALGKELWPLPT